MLRELAVVLLIIFGAQVLVDHSADYLLWQVVGGVAIWATLKMFSVFGEALGPILGFKG